MSPVLPGASVIIDVVRHYIKSCEAYLVWLFICYCACSLLEVDSRYIIIVFLMYDHPDSVDQEIDVDPYYC